MRKTSSEPVLWWSGPRSSPGMDAVHLETGRTRNTACGWYTMWSAVSTETLCLSKCAPSSSPNSASSMKKEYGRRSSLASSPLSSVSSCAGVTSCGRSSCGPAALE